MVYRWVQRFTPLFADAARPLRHATGDRWFVDETYVKVAGRWRYLYRAVDQYGQVIDVLLSEQRDTAAARRFFTRALAHGPAPVEVTTDTAGPYIRVLDELVPAAVYYAATRARSGTSEDAIGLTDRAYRTPAGIVGLVKDNLTLTVDATALPVEFGAQRQKRTDLAYETATVILGCWTGDDS